MAAPVHAPLITIVDTATANVRSLVGALSFLGISSRVTLEVDEVISAQRLILPGVGSFRQAMEHLRARGLDVAIRDVVAGGVPLLGICLGMQLLADEGSEDGVTTGLGLVAGRVARIAGKGVKVPHVGFNDVEVVDGSRLFDGLGDRRDFYFVHSYAFVPDDEGVVSSWCEHGGRFASSVERGHVFGTQFHPEKSQLTGLRLLMRFATGRWSPC